MKPSALYRKLCRLVAKRQRLDALIATIRRKLADKKHAWDHSGKGNR